MTEQVQVDFGELEKLLWNSVLGTFQQAMVEILSMIDDYLMAKRDLGRYAYKEKKERTIVTMVGAITISRRYYWDRDEKEWICLLDEVLGLVKGIQISDTLKELVVLWATKGPSYRDVSNRLEELFGVPVLSHEKVRQIVVESSEVIKKDLHMPEVKKKARILFIEADGFWTGVQGEPRRKKKETYMVVVHEGWEPRKGGGYRLINPMYITSEELETGEDIWDVVRWKIAEKYENIDEIQIVINGDFAPWIRAGAEYFKNALYQYDRFHLKRELRELFSNQKELCQRAFSHVDNNDTEGLFKMLDEVTQNQLEAAKLKKRLQKHQDSIIDYRVRLRSKGMEISSSWRAMGAAESNVDRFKLRTAKRGRAWSKRGLRAIINMLCMHYEGVLKDALVKVKDPYLAETQEMIEVSASQVAKKVGTGVLNIRKGGFPAINRGTEGYSKLFRSMLKEQTVHT